MFVSGRICGNLKPLDKRKYKEHGETNCSVRRKGIRQREGRRGWKAVTQGNTGKWLRI